MELKSENLIKLTDVKVIFSDLVDKGFGKSITIDASDEKVRNAITKWVATNKIGKNAGVPNFKEYKNEETGETTYQYTFKIGKFTKFNADGKSTENSEEVTLNRGDTISLIAKAYTFEHAKFGKGTTHSLNCVVVRKRTDHKSAMQMLIEE